MAANNVFLNGEWLPSSSQITYQDFKHWEQAMMYSRESSINQAQGQRLRQLSVATPPSPAFTPQADTEKRTEDVREIHPDAIVVRLARNRAALDALRRTRKMRYRHSLKYLAKSFPLADEVAAKNKRARAEAERAQGLTGAERLAQKKLAEQKAAEMTVEEMRYIKEMKAARVKAAATKRLQLAKERADKNEAAEKRAAEKKAAKKAGQNSLGATVMPRKAIAKAIAKPAAGQATERPVPINIFEKPGPKKKVVGEPAPEKITKGPVAGHSDERPVAKKQVTMKPVGKAMLKPVARKMAAGKRVQVSD